MMFGLGIVLLIDPLLISNLLITAGLVLGAIVLTWTINRLTPSTI